MYFTQITCLECGHTMPADIMLQACVACGSAWLNAEYDYAAVAQSWREELSKRDHSLWRYHELFPLHSPDPTISMGEGGTPLLQLYAYEQLYNHPHIYVKDERQNPTSSFKDRQAMLAVTALHQEGIKETAIASAGNAGVAYAAYCARAGIKLWLFVSSKVPAEKMREAALYGAEVIKVSGTYDEAKHIAAAFAERRGIYLDRGARFLPSRESMKTLAYEIAEQFALQTNPDSPETFFAPDWYLQAVSGGIGPLGVWKGFQELLHMGFIDKMPKLGIIQVAGCAPMGQAFQAGEETAKAVTPNTLVTVLSTGDPGYSYVQLLAAVRSNGGTMISVDDGQAFEAMRYLARHAGLSVEPATAVAFAGLETMLKKGIIQAGESVVVNGSGHTFPVESFILSDQYVLNLEIEKKDTASSAEGLRAALQNLDEQITTILIADDNSSDRRLIRRLLQRHKNYRIHEAHNGIQALTMAVDYKPDLIVTDLTMPEMDGFTLLEKLKHSEETAHIPVVVVSAKSLTVEDLEFLGEYTDSVWTKGNFDTHKLADHVVDVLGDTPIDVIKPDMKSLAAPAAEPSQTQYTIVIVDDSVRDLRLTRRLLESHGNYHVIEASTGKQGLEAIQQNLPDLVLLDLMMPDLDGFTILEIMQQDEALSKIPVIVLSAKELTTTEREQLRQSIQSMVQKASFDRKQFLATVEQTLTQD